MTRDRTDKRMSPSKAITRLQEHAEHLVEGAESREGTGGQASFARANAAACRLGAEALTAQRGEMEARHELYELAEEELMVLEQVELEAEMRPELRREVIAIVTRARKVIGDEGPADGVDYVDD